MMRAAHASALLLIGLALGFLAGCGGSSSSTTTPPPAETIAAAAGSTPQTAALNGTFASLVATVTTGGTGTDGASVTFTAPTSGASGTFAGNLTTISIPTDSAGNASAAFTANATAGVYAVTATATGATGTATFNLANGPTITATQGTPQNTQVGTPFATVMQATVMAGTTPVSGVTVTFTAPTSGAGGTFAGGATTSTATTDSSGVASAAAFTANSAFGDYTVIATVAGATEPADFSLTNTVSLTGTTLYSFYLSGSEAINSGPNFYALAGSVAIKPDGTVVAGEQDYNDGFGLTSPQPSGDQITSGTLTVSSSTGQGTLLLNTTNLGLGQNGVETLGVQFVNAKHALIIQFDGTATSSGSLDLQTLTSGLGGGYAFTLSGVDLGYASVVYGGVFTVSGSGFLQNGGTLQGIYDVDDRGLSSGTTPTLGNALTGTISPPDEFGRGNITGTDMATTLNYYIVGPEAIRIIDVDDVVGVNGDSAVGSAFGQGSATFTNASLGTSIFGVQSSWFGNIFAAAGMFTTNIAAATFTGVADDNEVQNGVQSASPAAISGTYSISNTNNGYGGLTITPPLGDVTTLGIYLTDPALNLSDPNNTSTGLGGALVADLDGFDLNGTGILIPQTDVSTTSFTSAYAFGGQELQNNIAGGEFDFIGQGTVSGLALSGTGLISDPWGFFAGSLPIYSNISFSGTAAADGSNPGRYTLPLSTSVAVTTGNPGPLNAVLYQASGGELFWVETDADSVFLGTLQQQGSLSGIPAARMPLAVTDPERTK